MHVSSDFCLQEALDAMTTDEAQLVSAVSMLKALGVEEETDIGVS